MRDRFYNLINSGNYIICLVTVSVWNFGSYFFKFVSICSNVRASMHDRFYDLYIHICTSWRLRITIYTIIYITVNKCWKWTFSKKNCTIRSFLSCSQEIYFYVRCNVKSDLKKLIENIVNRGNWISSWRFVLCARAFTSVERNRDRLIFN